MPIHEKSLIRPENLSTHDNLTIEGIDVSGDWSTFIKTRVVTDYNEDLQEEIAALPGGEYIHRCWQCGSCTNSCTINALNADFNPRHWIYLIRMGFEDELVRDKDLIWQCVSCNQCTYACPRDVMPEGVMKATSHWLERKGYTPKSPSMIFDEVFSEQVIERGKIEDGLVVRNFLARTGQKLTQPWLIQMVKQMVMNLPIKLLMSLGLAAFIKPKTNDWDRARDAITEYLEEQEAEITKAFGPAIAHKPADPQPGPVAAQEVS